MKTRITKSFTFEAAHHLPNHDGPCKRPHGHSYRCDLLLEGFLDNDPLSPKRGMVVDFSEVSRLWKEHIHAVVDHQDLNIVLPLPVTTAEEIAWWIFDTMKKQLPELIAVRLWETATGSAIVGGGMDES